MSISYIYISFINIKTCGKYDASSSVNEQIKTYISTTGGGGGGGGGGRKYKNYLYSLRFWGEKIQKLYFHDHFFSWGGGGGGREKKRRNKVLTFLLKKRA